MIYSAFNNFIMSYGTYSLKAHIISFNFKISFINRTFFSCFRPAFHFAYIFYVFGRTGVIMRNKTDIMCIVRNFIVNRAAVRHSVVIFAQRIFRNGAVNASRYKSLPIIHNLFLRLFRHCKHHNSGSISIKTVNDKRAVRLRIRPFFAHYLLKNINCSPRTTSRIRNGKHSVGFVNHCKIFIFIKNDNFFLPEIGFVFLFEFGFDCHNAIIFFLCFFMSDLIFLIFRRISFEAVVGFVFMRRFRVFSADRIFDSNRFRAISLLIS